VAGYARIVKSLWYGITGVESVSERGKLITLTATQITKPWSIAKFCAGLATKKPFDLLPRLISAKLMPFNQEALML